MKLVLAAWVALWVGIACNVTAIDATLSAWSPFYRCAAWAAIVRHTGVPPCVRDMKLIRSSIAGR